MAVEFNHTIVLARDSKASATFLAQILGLPEPKRWGPFQIVTTSNSVNIDFMDKEGEILTRHFAFLVGEAEFDEIFGRIEERGLTFWADPARTKEGEINTHRWRPRRLLPGSGRSSPGDHHAPLWERGWSTTGAVRTT